MNGQLIPVEKTDWLKISLAFFLGGMLFSMAFGIYIFMGNSDSFMTDGQCEDLMDNATITGVEIAVLRITQEAIQCNQIPINYLNYSYNLIAVECLNQGVQNG